MTSSAKSAKTIPATVQYRALAGTEHYGMDPDVPFALTAITTTVVDTAP